jgi:hypothetical protein
VPNKIIFTAEELFQFSKTSSFTIIELSKFIEDKTSQQYVIVQKDFVKAISNQLDSNTFHIFEINNFINEIWAKIVSTNQDTTDKWKEELSRLKNE